MRWVDEMYEPKMSAQVNSGSIRDVSETVLLGKESYPWTFFGPVESSTMNRINTEIKQVVAQKKPSG